MTRTFPVRMFLVLCICLALFVIAPNLVGPMKAKKTTTSIATAPAQPVVKTPLNLAEPQQLGPNIEGQWGPLETLDEVPVHISLLPDGRLLYWGRDKDGSSMKWDRSGSSQTYTWDPVTKAKMTIANSTTNLFCSGHSLMANGQLLVAGGHNRNETTPDIEAIGEVDVNVFDYRRNQWRLAGQMEKGRWYPSTVTMSNGETAIFSGKYWDGVKTVTDEFGRTVPNPELNIYPEMYTRQETLRKFQSPSAPSIPMYPYLHLAPNGKVFVSGTSYPVTAHSYYFDPDGNSGQGAFTTISGSNYIHNSGSSVLYDAVNGKIINTGNANPVFNQVSTIDLTNLPQWQYPTPMNHGRKYSTATLLPDGKVIVTGGTRCSGFNSVQCSEFPQGGAATQPEIWDGATWKLMAPNPSGIARVYHSVAILLPDARVLVGGGGLPAAKGEIANGEVCRDDLNPFINSVACRTFGHKDVEIFSPPYLYDGSGNPAIRPVINTAPIDLIYGQNFSVGLGDSTPINSVVLVRLGSVTHGLNSDQRRVVLSFTQAGQTLNVTGPANGTLAPPGPYMLFVLNSAGTPSVARIVNVLLRTNAENHIARRGLRSNGKVHVFYRHYLDRTLRYMYTPSVTNIAQGKSATQIDDAFGGVASRAVDGNTSGNYSLNSVTHTNYHAQAWWQVDLGAVGQLDKIRVWNRTDCCGDRVTNFYVLVSDTPFASTDLNATLSQPGVSAYLTPGMAGTPTTLTVNRTGRYVRVQLAGANWLNIAEVEVLGWSPAGNEPFSSPIDLGNVINSNPIAVENADGRLQVIVVAADNSIQTRAETAPGSGAWGAWVSPAGAVSNLAAIAAARNLDGRIQIFYRGSNNALWYISQTAANSTTWTSPASLGGSITSEPAVGINKDGRLEVFASGLDNALYHQWQNSPGGSWAGWYPLGGVLTSGPFVAHNSDGRLQVFVRGTDNGAHNIAQTAPNTLFGWTGWQAMGGSMRADQAFNNPVAALDANGRLQVFVRWEDNTLRTAIQNADGGFTYNGWYNLWGAMNATIPPPVRGHNGLFFQFARGLGVEVMVNRQTDAYFLYWSGFTLLGDQAHSF